MNAPAIEIHNLAMSFGKNLVLRDVSLAVPRGQTFALLGRNGEGKSTMIRLLLGLIKPDHGRLRVGGVDPTTDPLTLRGRVGYLAEDQVMYGWMRVEEIVCFVAPFYETWDHSLAKRYLDEFELPLRTKIKHLSKGQTVRLGLVLALAHRPEVVILDDPALGLDPVMRKQFNRDLITHLQGEGRTVFYSSHLLHEVEPIADRVAILHGGRIVRQGDVESFKTDVKRFFVSPGALPLIRRFGDPLDVRADGAELAVVAPGAEVLEDALRREGVPHNAVSLSLDEVFEAYVVGQDQAPPLPTPQPVSPIA